MSPNILGALIMMGSMAAFTINDTFIKLTDGAMPLWQLLFLRGMLTTCLIAGLGLWLKSLSLRISGRDWVFIGARSVAEIGAAYFFLTALLKLPLANVTAILQMLPLTVSLCAALFLGETLGWRRMAAILVGFVGMLLIVRPGTEGFNATSIYAVIAVGFVTLRDMVTRKMSAEVSSMTITLLGSVTVTVFAGIASIPQGWVEVTPRLATLICCAAVTIIAAYFFSVQAMRQGEIAFIAPFRYTSLVWALVLGWFVFADWPDTLTLLGGAIIVATGIFTLWREQRARASSA